MKYEVKFPDGRVEKSQSSAGNAEDLAVSAFGKSLTELQSEGYELTVTDETPVATEGEAPTEG